MQVGDLVRYYSDSARQEYIGIISAPDIITWFCDGEKENVDNYYEHPLEVISHAPDKRQLTLDF